MPVWRELDELIGAYSPNRNNPIAIAVSGGGDSMALLHKAAHWSAKTRRALLVLTVNHGLRAEAGAEAAFVADISRQSGLACQTLECELPKAQQSLARDVRHRLLANAARRAGADVLMVGHTYDDVMETVLMRARRKTPRSRLAGPVLTSPSPVWPEGRGLTLIRPLIRQRRADLRDWLRKADHDWCEDPSNEDSEFERVRVRQFLSRHSRLAEIVAAQTNKLVTIREHDDKCLGKTLANGKIVRIDAAGLIDFDVPGLQTEFIIRLLTTLLRVAGGHDRPPRLETVAALLAELTQPGDRRTLAGAWVQKTKAGLKIGRDPGAPRHSDTDEVWDGRFVEEAKAELPEKTSILMRDTQPPGLNWRPLIADRIAHEARAYQTLRVAPVQR